MNGDIWEIVAEVADGAHVAPMEAALIPFTDGIASFEDDDTLRWRVTGYAASVPDSAAIAAAAADAARAAGFAPPEFRIALLPPTDWVAEVEKSLKPISVGPYYVYGSHVTDPPPGGAIPIRIEAGLAFGTGSHETTRGCLMALERLYPDPTGGPARPFDIGTGSGILAIALAKRYGVGVLASDIDPIAVDVATANAADNGVADLTEFVVCAGLDHPDIAARSPCDLIVANIVVNPLIALAADFRAALAANGQLVLSGILAEQAGGLIAAYETAGFRPAGEIPLGNWRTLILEPA